jgi:Carboxypeptidase regulatory-like domain/TonB dependent receptor/TonB-dependent Receptor Plug Domain
MRSFAAKANGPSPLKFSTGTRTFLAALAVLVLSVPLFSQSYTSRILGSVHDKSDAVMVGASVVITDVQRDLSRTVVTDDAGEYVAPDLLPGIYKITVQAKGFKSYERTNVHLEVATDIRIDILLEPGEATETVTVTEQVPLINLTNATLGGTLSNEEINDLPLNGRNYENLLQLRPGVVRYPGGGFSTTSTNGLRAEDNAYLIDGYYNSEPFSGQSIINGAGIAGDSATILPIDAIQEFNVIENPPAEYGWKPGAIVNVAIKSGTNGLHGDAYAFGRDTALDARNFFNTVGTPKTPTQMEQFGTTIGGPIIKDKLFFFGGYEGQRYTVGNSFSINVPSMVSLPTPAQPTCTFILTGDCANSIPDVIADLQAGGITPSAVSLNVAGCTLGPPVTCNGKGFPLNNAPTTSFVTGFPNVVSANNAIGKVDYRINERNNLSGTYFFGNNSGTVDDALQLQPQWLTLIHTRAQVFGTGWTWTPSSRWANELRFGYNRLYQPTFSADHGQSAASLGINDGVTNPLYGGLPRIKIHPFGGLFETLGGFKWPKIQGPDERYQIIDHVSYTLGKHAFKFGGEFHRDSFSGGAFGDGKGYILFSGAGGAAFPTSTTLEDFFAGDPSGGIPFPTHALVGATPNRHIHNFSEAVFFQDDWRVTKNLTLNLGLRYDYNGVIREDNNLLGNFSPAVGLQQVGQQISAPYNGDHKNFAPRVGLAWDPFGTGRTVIRAGAGIVYEQVNWESFLAFNNVFGLGTIPTGGILNGVQGSGKITSGVQNIPNPPTPWDTWGVTTTPPFAIPEISCSAAQTCSILGVNPKITTPYVTTWTLNVQHAFTNTISLELAYVGDHGSNLMGVRDINQPAVGSNADEQGGRPFNTAFPFLSNIYQMANIYRSNYNGLQVTLTSRNYHGLTATAGYTYAHALDDVGANWDFGAGLGLPQDATHPGREYASSDFDIRHRFTLSFTYSIPGKKSPGQLLEGWQLISIVSLYSAQPWGPMDTGDDLSGTGEAVDRWDFVGKPSDFNSNSTFIPCFGSFNGNAPPGACNPIIAPACETAATAIGPGAVNSLNNVVGGCYMKGNSVMIPPAVGTFGTMGRNLFRDSGFRNWDFSVAKNWKFKERFGAQFRAEFFNVLNHPNFANPFGGQNGFGMNDPSAPGSFGCGCATPDVAGSNPVLGSGGARAIQLGLKLLF